MLNSPRFRGETFISYYPKGFSLLQILHEGVVPSMRRFIGGVGCGAYPFFVQRVTQCHRRDITPLGFR